LTLINIARMCTDVTYPGTMKDVASLSSGGNWWTKKE